MTSEVSSLPFELLAPTRKKEKIKKKHKMKIVDAGLEKQDQAQFFSTEEVKQNTKIALVSKV